ncbi:MAG: cytochrome C [Legionellales bacterium RIFCSPHIGHO2_12_FULL_42_9]|nr:MAG: cytochrome C [Legionellales bacterium RIFCSPHIGHO2_12_FULL_42_9]
MKKSIVVRFFIFVVMICLVDVTVASVSVEIMSKTQTCAACHGAEGVSSNPEWPNLAGQHATYLQKQLNDYKTGKIRNAVIMTGIAASLSDKDIEDLAKYYAALPRSNGKTLEKYHALGEKIYRSGDFDKGITACIACHGPKGTGNDEAGFPVLSGQQVHYTLQQLKAFKDKTRCNDLNHIMQDICGRMSQEDMAAVAYYMRGMD